MSLEQNGHYAAQSLFVPRVLSLTEIVLIPQFTGVSSQVS